MTAARGIAAKLAREAIVIAVLVAAPVLMLGPARSASAQEVPAGLGIAIRAYLASKNWDYAGECALSQDPDTHMGMWCSETSLVDDDRATVRIGPTFSEYMQTLNFEYRNDAWILVADATGDPGPPTTGAGLHLFKSTPEQWPGLVLGGIALLLAAATVMQRLRGGPRS